MKTKYQILEAVSESCETTMKIISGSRRTKKASFARDICAFILHKCGHSHEDISRTVNRERSSVTHMIKRVSKLINENSNRGRIMRLQIKDILDNFLKIDFIDIDERY